MRFILGVLAFVVAIGASTQVPAQTLYNSPSQAPTQGGGVKPLNLQELLRRNQPAAPQVTNNYANLGAYDGGFERRLQMLNQTRAQRDQQAWIDQENSRNYMIALDKSADPATFGVPLEQLQQQGLTTTPLPMQPVVPLIYNKPQSDVEKPRPLFNSVE